MPTIAFTANLNRHLECREIQVEGSDLREVLDSAFVLNPKLKGYVLDDQGAIRKHVAIFIDNQPVLDRRLLGDVVPEDGEVFVMQALSGG